MTEKKTVLFIVPMPPPLTGQSKISKDVYDYFKNNYNLVLLNYARTSLAASNLFNFGQILKTLFLIFKILKYKKKTSFVYLNLSVSLLGNLKDMLLLAALGSLRKKTIVHIHSGGFVDFYNKSFFLIKKINGYLLKDIYKTIVLGESVKKSYKGIIDIKKIIVINNYFEKELTATKKYFYKKWHNPDKINLLFLSNMIIKKGYLDLLNGFLNLDEKTRNKCNLYFAGSFENKKNKTDFFKKIKSYKNIFYYENVKGKTKTDLFKKSHAFFLPSYLPEGQPLAILEAYASGCVVFTTDIGGIKNIFINNVNGKFIKGNYRQSIQDLIVDYINNFNYYKKIALFNLQYSGNFTKEKFINAFDRLFDELSRR